MRTSKLVGFVLVLALAGCSTTGSPTAPSSTSQNVSVALPPPGITITEGNIFSAAVSIPRPDGPTGSVAWAFVLVRDDKALAIQGCGAFSLGPGFTGVGASWNLLFQGPVYLWAKGHVLDGALLQAHFDDPREAFHYPTGDGCYFRSSYLDPFSVNVGAMTKREDIQLGWVVQ